MTKKQAALEDEGVVGDPIWVCIDGTIMYAQPNEYALAVKYIRAE